MKQVSNYNKLERLFSGISLFLTTTMITSSRDSCSSGSNRRHLFHQKVVVASPLPERAETTECGGAGYRGSYRNFDRSSSWDLCHSAIYMVAEQESAASSPLHKCTQHPIFLCFDQLGSHDNIQIICFDRYVRLINDYLRKKFGLILMRSYSLAEPHENH